jgi:hypothetical protein
MKPITYCDFEMRDSHSLCSLLKISFVKEYAALGFSIDKYKSYFKVIGFINKILRPLKHEFFKIIIAKSEGKVIGSSISYPIDKHVWFLGFFASDPEFRGRGIYTNLLSMQFAYLSSRKAKAATAEMSPGNPAPVRVWVDKFNATKLREYKIYLCDPSKHCFGNTAPFAYPRIDNKKQSLLPASIENLNSIMFSGISINRNLIDSVINFLLPPLIIKSYAIRQGDAVVAFARTRRTMPGNIWAIDFCWKDASLSRNQLLAFITALLQRISGKTKNKIWVYAEKCNEDMDSICKGLGLEFLEDSYFMCKYLNN